MTRPEAGRWRWHAGAGTLYVAVSVLLLDHGASLTQTVLGPGSDPFGFVWFLSWWPYAAMHGLDPFWTGLIWRPVGYAPMWGSAVPLLAAAVAPLTIFCSPVLAYNLLVLAAPVLSAACAYLLCLRVTATPSAALAGGYVFGFSAYQMAQAAILNLCFTFLLPCLLLVVLARLSGGLGRAGAVGLACLILVCEFLISTEIFAMLFLFGGIGWLVAYAMLPRLRGALNMLLLDAAVAAAVAAALLAPLLVSMFSRYPFVHLPALWPHFFSADLLAFLLPSQNTLLGGQVFQHAIHGFFTDLQEQDSYVGLPLLLIVYGFARQYGREPAARFLVVTFLLLLLFSLGPRLWVFGAYTRIPMPWAGVLKLPLLGGALPVRFALYAALAAALMVAQWIARAAPGRVREARLLGAGLGCVAMLPVFNPVQKLDHSRFFMPGRVQEVLGPAPNLLVLPFGPHGPSSYWQVENHFGFAQTGGYLGFPPAAAQNFPAAQELFSGDPNALVLDDLRAFCAAAHTGFIVAGPGTPPEMLAKLGELKWPSRQVDDVTIFNVPGATRG
jgi:hypothetical protein